LREVKSSTEKVEFGSCSLCLPLRRHDLHRAERGPPGRVLLRELQAVRRTDQEPDLLLCSKTHTILAKRQNDEGVILMLFSLCLQQRLPGQQGLRCSQDDQDRHHHLRRHLQGRRHLGRRHPCHWRRHHLRQELHEDSQAGAQHVVSISTEKKSLTSLEGRNNAQPKARADLISSSATSISPTLPAAAVPAPPPTATRRPT
jgi:hypothetical protein